MGEYSNINFKKKFGQNFLSDKNLLASIVRDAGITEDDAVLEIGAPMFICTLPWGIYQVLSAFIPATSRTFGSILR